MFGGQGDPKASSFSGHSNDTTTFSDSFNRLTAFISLRGGEQFVAIEEGPEGRRVYFGGTDKKPFLVELELWLGKVLEREGPEAFYEALKPDLIRRLEKAYKGSTDYTERQGDIWAFHLPYSWDQLRYQPRIIPVHYPMTTGTISVFGTRHTLTGSWMWYPRWLKIGREPIYIPPGCIVGGILRSPGHCAIHLTPLPCVIARTKGIKGPHQSLHSRIGY